MGELHNHKTSDVTLEHVLLLAKLYDGESIKIPSSPLVNVFIHYGLSLVFTFYSRLSQTINGYFEALYR